MFQFFQVTHFYQIEYLSGLKLAILANLAMREASLGRSSRLKPQSLTKSFAIYILNSGGDHPSVGGRRSGRPSENGRAKFGRPPKSACNSACPNWVLPQRRRNAAWALCRMARRQLDAGHNGKFQLR